MNRNARWLPLFLLAAALPAALGEGPPAGAPNSKNTHFQRNQGEINSLDCVAPGSAFIAGAKAIYAQDGDILHWRAIDSLVSSDYRKLAGGDKDHLFFTVPGEVNSGLSHLKEWTRATGGTAELGLVYDMGQCHFVDATHGAVIAPPLPSGEGSPDVLITTDAAKTWTRNKNVLGSKKEVYRLMWLSAEHLLVGGHDGAAYCNVDAQGHLARQWSLPLQNTVVGFFPGPQGTVWMNAGDHAVKIDLATGKILADLAPDVRGEVIAEIGTDLWLGGDTQAAIYRADADGQWKPVKKFGYPWPSSASTFRGDVETKEPPGGWVHWIVAGPDGHGLLIGIDGQTYTWDGKSDVLSTAPLIINNTAVAAADQIAADKEITPAQVQEFMSLMNKMRGDHLGDLFAAQKEKEESEHWTKRESVAWVISEMKKLVDSDAKNGPPPPRTATGMFDSPIYDLRIFSPTSGIAITGEGVMVTDGSFDRWKGQMGWEHPLGSANIVGATESQFYFITDENREVVVKEGFDPPAGMERDNSLHRVTKNGKQVLIRYEYTFTLFRWTREASGGKLQEIRKLPRGALYDSSPAACAFASEKTGAFVDGQTLMITRDAGATWIATPLALTPPGFRVPERVMQIAFSDEDHLVITSGGESIALLSIDKEGHGRQQWTKKIFGRFGDGQNAAPLAMDPQRKLVWVFSESPAGQGSRMEAFNLADGTPGREFNPFGEKGENLTSYSIVENQMLSFGSGAHGGNLLRIWNLQNNPPTQTAQVAGSITAAYAVPGKATLFLALNHQQLIEWNGKPEIPAFLTSDIRRPNVDNTLLSAAEDRWPPGSNASRKDSAALAEARNGLTAEQSQQLLDETAAKAKDFENDRARVLWMTQRALELRAHPNPEFSPNR